MIRPIALFIAGLLACDTGLCAQVDKPRVFVLTDISNEPDDEESMARFLVYANEYDVEGLVATTSTWLRSKTREDLIRRQLDAYGQVHPDLSKHAPGFPTKEQLLAVKSGNTVQLTAEGTSDPDGDAFEVRWWIYPEASTLRDARGRTFPSDVKLSADKGLATTLVTPLVRKVETVHVICAAKDSGQPALWSYRRAILRLQP
jgi:hypothetical protein